MRSDHRGPTSLSIRSSNCAPQLLRNKQNQQLELRLNLLLNPPAQNVNDVTFCLRDDGVCDQTVAASICTYHLAHTCKTLLEQRSFAALIFALWVSLHSQLSRLCTARVAQSNSGAGSTLASSTPVWMHPSQLQRPSALAATPSNHCLAGSECCIDLSMQARRFQGRQ